VETMGSGGEGAGGVSPGDSRSGAAAGPMLPAQARARRRNDGFP
jgi:hypothetical protein